MDNNTINQIRDFCKLKDGWDGYEARSPNNIAIEKSIELYESLTVKPNRVKPSVIGGIGMSWGNWQNPPSIYVEIYNNGNIHSIFRTGDKEPIIMKEEDIRELNEKIIKHVTV